MPNIGPLEILLVLLPIVVVVVIVVMVTRQGQHQTGPPRAGTPLGMPAQPAVPIATFGPTTGWVGRSTSFEHQKFILDGHGQVTPEAVLEYDRQGQLVWAYDGLREWVRQLAAGTAHSATDIQTTIVSPRNAGFCPTCGKAVDPLADSFCPACGRAQMPTP